MKKVEIITKSNGKKKSQVVKIKGKSDLSLIGGIINFFIAKEKLPDLDLTGSVSFKVDGDKVSVSELSKMVRKELKDAKSDSKEKTSKEKTNEPETDSKGRIIIHSRRQTLENNKKEEKKKKDKKSSFVDKKKKNKSKKSKDGKKKKGKKGKK